MNLHGWESSLDGRRVLIIESVARDLRMAAIEGFTALRRRGLEVGGLLFGYVGSDELRIEEFQRVACEHRYGPSYVLSDSDRENLTGLLSRRRTGPPVLGFYRSFTGREPAIEPADEALVAEHFSNGELVFLLLHPLSAENCVASFRFFRDGQLLPAQGPEEPVLEFAPKRVSVMQVVAQPPEQKPVAVLPPSRRRREEEQEQEPAEEPARHLVPPPAWTSEPVPRRSGWWKAALLCVASVLGGAFVYELGWSQRPRPPAQVQFVELHLDARPDGGKLDVRWDPAAARSLSATRGALTISDDGAQREIELGAAEVGAGRYTYAPEGGDIGLRLTLFGNGRTVAAESARVAGMAAVAAPTPVPATDGQIAAPLTTVREVQPAVPDGIRSRINGRIVVPVDVRVNERGRVVSTRSDEVERDGLHRYLAGLAQNAARRWQFKPARGRDGSPMASSKRIEFVFTP